MKVWNNCSILTSVFSFPSKQVNPDIYLNRGSRTQFLALKKDTALVCAVEQLDFILSLENVKTIIKIEFDKEQIVACLKKSSLIERVIIFHKFCYKWKY
jgi:CTP synthase (UTP-ammonia lyase)